MDFFFEQYNIHTNLSDFEECDSCGDLFMLKGVAEKYELEDFDASEAYKKFLTMYVETYAESGRLFAFRGVVNLVDRLRNGGLRIVVTTNATRPKAEANARAIGLRVSDFCFTISEYVTSDTDTHTTNIHVSRPEIRFSEPTPISLLTQHLLHLPPSKSTETVPFP